MIGSLAVLFCLSFAVGIGATLLLLRFNDLEPKFFRVNAIIAAVLLLAAFSLARVAGISALGILAVSGIFIVYSATVLWLPQGFERGLLIAGVVWGSRALYFRLVGAHPSAGSVNLNFVSVLSGGLLMGASLVAMNVGHWYLSAAKLTLRPLKMATSAVMGLVGLRFLWLLVVLPWMGWTDPRGAADLRSFVEYDHLTLGAVGLIRILFGIAGPLVLSWMAWETVKISATQSATGILFPSLSMVLVGETCAIFLTLQTSLPV